MTASLAAGPRGWLRHPPLRLTCALAVAALTLVPLGYVAVEIAATGGDLGDLLWRPRVGELLRHTVLLVALGTTACMVLGTAAALIVERTDLPGRPLWTGLMAAPLAVPAYVNSFGWYSLSPSFGGLGPAVLVTTLSYYPLVYLPVAAALRGADPSLAEVSRSLGRGRWVTFARVELPLLRPAVLGGGLLVGLHLLAEFGALQNLRYDTFTTAIYDQYQSTFDGSGATALAGVLVLLCLVLLGGDLWLTGRTRYARTGAGASRRAPRHRLGHAAPLAAVALAALAAAAVGLPLGCISYWLATSRSSAFPAGDLLGAATSTATLALLGAVVTTVLALPVAWLAERRRSALTRLVERSTYIGNSLPGIVVALALVTVAIRYTPGLYQTTVMLLAAYAVLFMPRATVSLRSALSQTPPALDDVARSLGVGPAGVLARVTVPLMARGIGAGAALVFLAVTTELTATLLLAPIGTRTLATEFWSESTAVQYGAAAPYALLMIAISAPAAFLLTRRSRHSEGGQ
ncbi:iron(III) transport system permease protein [Parafrankia irregularis]|uniref:Iron(III) transport system permease protein n=1 Tax=Parafrankia irregularis TaxID=795642 RepID=A0A0S4QUX6_9ACTN|nr:MULTISPECIES: iron ABC transporter permease [Parafrankia]MBE3201515.1 iron ABC transporter permease [Parafrankia sp. CH37]CUU59415.1 iron(III) transport system permease protein [Parafrankia irregularis]